MPSIARQGDKVYSLDGFQDNCGFPGTTNVGEVNTSRVYVNGILIPVAGNKVAPHNLINCDPDESTLTSASTRTFVGGRGIGRVGDKYNSMSENVIIQGSTNTFSG